VTRSWSAIGTASDLPGDVTDGAGARDAQSARSAISPNGLVAKRAEYQADLAGYSTIIARGYACLSYENGVPPCIWMNSGGSDADVLAVIVMRRVR
jgi:hypothetical protein